MRSRIRGAARGLELAVGRAQYRAVVHLLRTQLGLSRSVVRVTLGGLARTSGDAGQVDVALFARPGEGLPIVLVHGFGGHKEGWLSFARELPRARPLVIVDLPGYGESGAPPAPFAAAGPQAYALAQVLERAAAPRAHVVGSSMGGGVTLRLAWDAPARVASMVLLGSVGPVVEQSDVGREIDRGTNPLLLRSPDDMDRLLGLIFQRPPRATRAILRHLGGERFARSAALSAQFEAWVSASPEDALPDDLSSIAVPALVVHGARDRVIHASTGRALALRLPLAELVVLSAVGHVPQIEAARETARALTAFIERVEASGR